MIITNLLLPLGHISNTISKYSNEHLFCVPVPLMERQGAVSIFHAKRVILMMSVYSLILA
jgi:hypothetical protein